MGENEAMSKDIGERIDRLCDHITALNAKMDQVVRLEERQTGMSHEINKLWVKSDAFDNRIRQLEVKNEGTNTKVGTNERMVWAVVTVIFSIAAYSLKS